jgi:hypothetical protein
MTDINDKSRAELEALLAEVQAALAAKDDEPLLEDAAAVCCDYFKSQDLPAWKEYLPGGRYSKDLKDPELNVALAALRRGMELASAPAEPVDEAWIERTVRECADKALCSPAGSWVHKAAYAAIRATLSRSARWPGGSEWRAALDAAHYYIDASDEELKDAGMTREGALDEARRLRAHMTGETE